MGYNDCWSWGSELEYHLLLRLSEITMDDAEEWNWPLRCGMICACDQHILIEQWNI